MNAANTIHSMRRVAIVAALVVALGTVSSPAFAVDTNETIDHGAMYFEFFVGYYGVNKPLLQQQVVSGGAMAFGLAEGFTGYLSLAGRSNPYFGDGYGRTGFGLLYTVYNSPHVSIDLMLDAGTGGAGPQPLLFHPAAELNSGFAVTPGLEFNYDHDEEMNDWGLFGVVQEIVTGRTKIAYDDELNETVTYTFAPWMRLTTGAYITAIPDTEQWLIQALWRWRQNPDTNQATFQVDGIGMGYNRMLNDELEVATEIYLDIPNETGEVWGIGLGIGVLRW